MKKWTKNEKKCKNKKQEKRQKNWKKVGKNKRGPKGVPPEMGAKIDFSHENCQEKS